MNNKVNILGVFVDKVTIPQATDKIMSFISADGEAKAVYTPNSEIIMHGYRDESLRDILNEADLLTADGIGVVYASKILGNPISERCAGYDVACNLLAEMGSAGKSVYLFGSKPGIADLAGKTLVERYPGLVIAGTSDGYFDVDKEKQIIADINRTLPDVLFVCLGAPKQERWIATHKDELNCKVCMGLGGCLDVFAGTVERAPDFFCNHGIEWLYRLMKQPKRFIRMLDLPKFALTVLLKGRKFSQDR